MPTPPDRLMSELHGFDGFRFHAVKLLKIVNHLIGLGAAQSWNILQSYARASKQKPELKPENALVVARVLFVATALEAPSPRVELGTPDIRQPDDPRQFPSWPLHLERGLPLMLIGGYTFAGQPMPVDVQLAAYKAQMKIRTEKIAPDGCAFAIVERFLASDEWRTLGPRPDHDDMLRLQAWRAVDTIVPLTATDERAASSGALGRDRWREVEQTVYAMKPSWDPEGSEYRRQ
jgi:hypothetical protein